MLPSVDFDIIDGHTDIINITRYKLWISYLHKKEAPNQAYRKK